MDIFSQTRGLKLISRLFSPNKTVTPAIPFYPQKPTFEGEKPISQPFERVTPESVGISSDRVNAFLTELKEEKSVNMHGITLIRNGKIFCEGDFGLYRSCYWHTTYSMCKTVISLAVGMLFDEGVLSPDDRVVDILEAGHLTRLAKGGITVKELLTMSTGISFNELGAVTDTDWEKAFFESVAKFDAGDGFEYNSMNTYMLSRIIKKVTGVGVNEYLESRLWTPLGIDMHPWEVCPKGTEKGGWGLYLRREDAAKLGVLILNGGVWNGKRLISEKYISLALRHHRITPAEYGGFDYGCQVWTGRNYKSFLLNGMFGQNVLGIQENGIVIASNGGNDEVFQQSPFFTLVEKYFGNLSVGDPLPENKKAYKRLCKTASSLYWERREGSGNIFSRIRAKGFLASVSGTSYTLTSKNAVSASLLPVVLRAVQNNHGSGIKKVSFIYEQDKLYIDFISPDGVRRVAAGTKNGEYTQVDFGKEKYVVGAFARVGKNEDGVYVITLFLSFCETASERVIKFFFLDDNTLRMTFTERPGAGLFDKASEMLLGKGKILSSLAGKTDADYLRYRINATFNPEYIGEKE